MHIPEYSQIVSPLYLVTHKKNDFHWGPEQQQAFAQIKQEMAHAVALSPVKTRPDVKNVLYSAARSHGLSWSLWQKVPGETRSRPLGFWSRSYRGSKANYTPTEKEILAAYKGVQAASKGYMPRERKRTRLPDNWIRLTNLKNLSQIMQNLSETYRILSPAEPGKPFKAMLTFIIPPEIIQGWLIQDITNLYRSHQSFTS
ncbi:hypothetical protein DUI87_02068 [Hirundo rustica rustica]|uniref:Reverse transcriptase/retrotransposon-derived protein RNase H-like domain-containing protein n=1 Tax=Hirundo rustica rustica TaxID=333673 RepID=A0A3M0LE28_HIRRU|nr:hypothetical protein DUI87_02068 [Hirundo rustica rustica]